MSFSEAEKVDIRFFCGYPIYGAINVSSFGFRYFQFFGLLEFRMLNMKPEEEAVVRDMLVELRVLKTDIYAARDNLDTDRAAVWYRNRTEVNDRDSLFKLRRKMLCDFLGIPYKMGLVGYSYRLVN